MAHEHCFWFVSALFSHWKLIQDTQLHDIAYAKHKHPKNFVSLNRETKRDDN